MLLLVAVLGSSLLLALSSFAVGVCVGLLWALHVAAEFDARDTA